jgi:ligand-binding SRPBCC domain-containing protein
MRLHFDAKQWVPCAPERVFAFFANPENLPRLMPRWQQARIEEATFAAPPPRPPNSPRYPGVVAGDGTRLLLSFRMIPYLPMRLPWEAQIEDFRWNQGFCDTQISGPFAYWRHCHTVEAATEPESGRSGSFILDEVEYELPFGGLGAISDRVFVRRSIARIFRYRHQRTAEILSIIDRLTI